MEYRQLGGSDLRVSVLCLGTMTFGEQNSEQQAHAQLDKAVARGVILAPQQGVSRDARGQPTALVVGADNVVEARVLEVLQARGADWVVTKGLEAGDRLIVEGLQKARPGATVAPEERAAAAPVAAASR